MIILELKNIVLYFNNLYRFCNNLSLFTKTLGNILNFLMWFHEKTMHNAITIFVRKVWLSNLITYSNFVVTSLFLQVVPRKTVKKIDKHSMLIGLMGPPQKWILSKRKGIIKIRLTIIKIWYKKDTLPLYILISKFLQRKIIITK